MASVLNGYEDPRISIYYSPATLTDHTEEYLGVPQGVYAKDGDPNYYQSYSFINTKTIAASTPAVLLTAAEVWLLRAEASLRGINPKAKVQSNVTKPVFKLHSTNGAPEMQASIWQAKANRQITLIMQQVPERYESIDNHYSRF